MNIISDPSLSKKANMQEVMLEDLNRYDKHPATQAAIAHHEDPRKSAELYNGNTKREPGTAVNFFNEGAGYNPIVNKIILPNSRGRSAIFHERGHNYRDALNLDSAYWEPYFKVRQAITPSAAKTGPDEEPSSPADKMYQARAVDIMESGASGFGAKDAMRFGMSRPEAYEVAFSGLPTYRHGLAEYVDMYPNKLQKALINSAVGNNIWNKAYKIKNRPAYRPARTDAEAQQAIQAEHDIQHGPGRSVMMPLGSRTIGFTRTGKWVPGMEPLTDDEVRLHDYVYSPMSIKEGPNIFAPKAVDKVNMKRLLRGTYTPSVPYDRAAWVRDGNAYIAENINKGKQDKWRTIGEYGHDLANVFNKSDDANAFSSAVDSFKKDDTPLYLDRNDPNNVRDYMHGLRGFRPDATLPTAETQRYLDRINRYDPKKLDANRSRFYRDKYGRVEGYIRSVTDKLRGYNKPTVDSAFKKQGSLRGANSVAIDRIANRNEL